ncbi:unnamed protein product [Chrysodeixis includens]|uniref:Hexosyltransferase n=1 Tax=Chrysodeixis includens TaxID=689277 RepID=A0A9P0BYF0_CHRIL|nr:unnamed protein product [Chrysodeixis includens]
MDDERHWYDDDRLYPSGRDSDDSPILSHRYDKSRRVSPYSSPRSSRGRRSTLTVLAKFFLFCTAMILFCVLLYIPVYNRANDQVSKGTVAGWSINTNRDTKIYVQPQNTTTILSPKEVCNKNKDKIFLLIVVCSATRHFSHRLAIRQTWGSHNTYHKLDTLYHGVKNKYINYNYTYDLYETGVKNTSVRTKRDISGYNQLLPELAKALKKDIMEDKSDSEDTEKRFEDENDFMLPEFDMSEEIEDQTESSDYYETNNVMVIPPKGESNPDLQKVLEKLKTDKNFKNMQEKLTTDNTELNFKVVFLLGLPTNDNNSVVQRQIVAESEKYGDIIQEDFIDSYNNLTLKSIMMLKWITNSCNDSVRYILKTDDDMYINVPNLMENLRNRSRIFDENFSKGTKEYLLIGDLICGARPVLDSHNKWYSPRYMFGGRVYPRYLSGTGYALAAPVARALYAAALRTNYFHLEDIFITGMCASRARPRIVPRDDPSFSYQSAHAGLAGGLVGPHGAGLGAVLARMPAGWAGLRACAAHARATEHRVTPSLMRTIRDLLLKPDMVDVCERLRLTQIKQEQRRLYVLYKFLRLLVSPDCS